MVRDYSAMPHLASTMMVLDAEKTFEVEADLRIGVVAIGAMRRDVRRAARVVVVLPLHEHL